MCPTEPDGSLIGEARPLGDVDSENVVLVVEDEILVRMMLAEELRNAGFKVIEASNAEEALDVLAHKLDVKLIVTDIRMPGTIDGVEFARLIRSLDPLVKVVLTSADPEMIRDNAYDGSFRKPYNPAVVIAYVIKLLGRDLP